MKQVVWIGLILLLVSCEKDKMEAPVFYFGAENKFYHEITYRSQDQDIAISTEVISDSRCPINAYCVWQGEAKVAVALQDESLHLTVLSTYDNQVDTINNIRLELVDVEPYPESGNDIELCEKTVTLRIDKVN